MEQRANIALEVKFLDIDAEAIRTKLSVARAGLVFSEVLMKRRTFDFPDFRLEKTDSWVRVREEGQGKITLTYKQLVDKKNRALREIEMIVKSFEDAAELLAAIGLEVKSYQETKREKWMLGDVEVVIDTWPWLPTFLVLQAASDIDLQVAAKQLGLDWDKAVRGSVELVYQNYYDIDLEEAYHWQSITFVPIPLALEAKRRKK